MKTITLTHIENIRPGDVIVHNGREMTVSASDISRDPFMGVAVFGDCYRLGTKPVERVNYEKAMP